MTKMQRLLTAGLLLLCAAPAFAAPIGFETGDFTGWTFEGSVFVEGEIIVPVTNPMYTVAPTEGLYQALLISNGVAAGELETFFGLSAGYLTDQLYVQGSGLTRDFVLGLGDILSFDWNFVAGDAFPFNDAALFISDGAGTLLSSVELIGDFANTEYQTFSFVAPSSSTYSIGVGVFDHADQLNESYLAVDNFNVTPVPEPGTLLLLIGGLGTTVISRYRASRRKAD